MPMPSWEAPYISMHVVWHPRCRESGAAAVYLIEHFMKDRYSIEEMGISVFEWSTPPHGSSVPAPVDLATGKVVVVVVLVGNELQRDLDWSDYVVELAGSCRSGDGRDPVCRLFPVAVDPGPLSTNLGVQALRWHNWEGDRNARARRLVREVTYESSRLLRTVLVHEPDLASQMEKVQVFLSHSKHDQFGEKTAQRIRNWLQNDVPLSVFLDIADVPAGLPPDQVLEQGVRQSALLIVHSDSYSSREWCRREVLVAKENHRPIVVADCLEDLDERVFPYVGNVPMVRLCPTQSHGIERVVGRLLDEVFKDFLWQCRTAALCYDNPSVLFLPRPPELLTLVNVTKTLPDKTVLVYPDPPLGSLELSLVDGFGPEVLSLSEWLSEGA